MRFNTAFSLLFFVTILFSCQKERKVIEPEKFCKYKDQECDSALFVIGNQTNQIIYFDIGSNFYKDSISPKEVRTIKMRSVKVTFDKKTCDRNRIRWSSNFIHSSVGDWNFNVDHCTKTVNFRYDIDSVRITMFDDTDY